MEVIVLTAFIFGFPIWLVTQEPLLVIVPLGIILVAWLALTLVAIAMGGDENGFD